MGARFVSTLYVRRRDASRRAEVPVAGCLGRFATAMLDGSTIRLNALRHEMRGIGQKMLGQTLEKLERNGLVDRIAKPTMPMTVDTS